jgi:hypothetical protein
MEDGLRMERRRSPRESRESLRQVERAQGEVTSKVSEAIIVTPYTGLFIAASCNSRSRFNSGTPVSRNRIMVRLLPEINILLPIKSCVYPCDQPRPRALRPCRQPRGFHLSWL